ncbi:MAG TPA: methyltransferase domain-containing protein [Kofleriaceae bacterium]
MSTASGWEKWAAWNTQQQRPIIDWLVDHAAIRAGHTVLDIACGVGQPAIEAARRGAAVIATDVAADMLAGCERLAKAAGVSLELRELDMHDLRGVGDASVDAVTFGFALMFSPDPVKVMREVHRVLKPGAQFALAVWDEPAKNHYFTTIFGALGQVVPMPAPKPDAPGPFKLAPPGELERVIRAAGFEQVTVESVPCPFVFESLDHHFEVTCDMAGVVKRAVAQLTPTQLAQFRSVLATTLAPFRTGAGERISVLTTPLCASGRK